jgi:TusA-related sulfurtransferase
VVTVLDCRGRPCPQPIIDLARAFRSLEIGEEITVEADDPAAAYDVPAWCRMRGQEYVREGRADDGTPLYVVRRIS